MKRTFFCYFKKSIWKKIVLFLLIVYIHKNVMIFLWQEESMNEQKSDSHGCKQSFAVIKELICYARLNSPKHFQEFTWRRHSTHTHCDVL